MKTDCGGDHQCCKENVLRREETMRLCHEIDRLRKVCADAAADLVRECRAKDVDTMWHGNGCTLWELLNMNGAELEEPVESPPID